MNTPSFQGKTIPFLKSGGLKLIFHSGFGIIGRLLTYEKYAMNLKKAFTENYDWYLYNLSIGKDAQGKGIASKLMRPMLQFCDDEKMVAYLQNREIFIFDGFAGADEKYAKSFRIINELAEKKGKVARIALRINPNVGAHTHSNITTGLAENKFGINLEQIEGVIEQAIDLPHIDFEGVHFHIGSQILDMIDFVALCNRVNELTELFERRKYPIRSINVGGGLGIDYKQPDLHPVPDFRSYFDTYRQKLLLRPGQQLHFELGRAIMGQCGTLVSRVLYIKSNPIKNFCIVDAGMTDLIRPALYNAYHHIENLTASDPGDFVTYDVVGPICESSDVFIKNYGMPRTSRGDLIAFRSAGAYGEIMASGYNCRNLPIGYITEDLL